MPAPGGAKTPLVRLAREATSHREAGDDYGGRQRMRAAMGQIAGRSSCSSARGAGLGEQIRVRSERLQRVARYRAANDAPRSWTRWPLPRTMRWRAARPAVGAWRGAQRARRRHLGPVPRAAALIALAGCSRRCRRSAVRPRARDHVRHDLGRLIEYHIRGVVLGLLQLLHGLQRRQVLGRAPAVLAIQPLACRCARAPRAAP